MQQRIGGYQLLGELARGAMGVVYRAHDPALGREVAIKVLLGALRAPPDEVERFRQEAQIVARLDHPHIVRVHAAGEHQGVPYLVMDLLEGETLRARLRREGPLPTREAARLARHLAEALHAAHEAGILHRDVKPDNVMLLRDGRPILTDFGLAKVAEAAGQRGLTRTGEVMGTPAYMAPEQAQGRRDLIGPAVDVYGLGATLYEMLCGHAPFDAGSAFQTMDQVVRQAPVPPSRRHPGVDPQLEAACLRCLAKAPADRYSSAEALARRLRRLGRASSPNQVLRPAPAVASRGRERLLAALLPLVALISATLGWVVAPRQPAAAPEVARLREAGAAAARTAAETALAEARDDAAAARREAEEARRALTEATAELARLRQRVDAPEARVDEVAEAPPLAPAARAALLAQARQLVERGDLSGARTCYDRLLAQAPDRDAYASRAVLRLHQGDVRGSIADSTAAIELDPDYATPWFNRSSARYRSGDAPGALADLEHALARTTEASEEVRVLRAKAEVLGHLQRYADARADCDRALALAPDDPHLLASRGLYRVLLGDHDGACADAERALELEPRLTSAWHTRALVLSHRGDHAAAVESFSRVLELEPRHAEALLSRAGARVRLGQPEAALADLDRALTLSPGLFLGWLQRGRVRRDLGRATAAIEDLERALSLAPNDPYTLTELGGALADLGRFAPARRHLDRAIAAAPEIGQAWYERARIRREAGDGSGARADCERALSLLEEHHPDHPKARELLADLAGG